MREFLAVESKKNVTLLEGLNTYLLIAMIFVSTFEDSCCEHAAGSAVSYLTERYESFIALFKLWAIKCVNPQYVELRLRGNINLLKSAQAMLKGGKK